MKKRWGRRVGTAIAWAVLAYGATHLQPVLETDVATVKYLIQKSAEIAMTLILGLSATDYIALKNNK